MPIFAGAQKNQRIVPALLDAAETFALGPAIANPAAMDLRWRKR